MGTSSMITTAATKVAVETSRHSTKEGIMDLNRILSSSTIVDTKAVTISTKHHSKTTTNLLNRSLTNRISNNTKHHSSSNNTSLGEVGATKEHPSSSSSSNSSTTHLEGSRTLPIMGLGDNNNSSERA